MKKNLCKLTDENILLNHLIKVEKKSMSEKKDFESILLFLFELRNDETSDFSDECSEKSIILISSSFLLIEESSVLSIFEFTIKENFKRNEFKSMTFFLRMFL